MASVVTPKAEATYAQVGTYVVQEGQDGYVDGAGGGAGLGRSRGDVARSSAQIEEEVEDTFVALWLPRWGLMYRGIYSRGHDKRCYVVRHGVVHARITRIQERPMCSLPHTLHHPCTKHGSMSSCTWLPFLVVKTHRSNQTASQRRQRGGASKVR